MVWPTRLIYLTMGEVLCDGFNLAVFYIPVTERDKTHIFIVAIKDKMMGSEHIACLTLSTSCHLAPSVTLLVMNLIP